MSGFSQDRNVDGSHRLRFRGRYLPLVACPAAPPPSASPSGLRPPGLADRKRKPQIHSPCQPPLEATVEADISILRKTGHFYFALTRHLKPVDMPGCLCYSALFRGYSVVVVS